ncbi:unnamed protein product, partial [Mesorhabditis belari]|uniref:Uncharacterized protein n=1 Tax=Mesorhabditis belari TaxID=2138241 RepID=A0AAF3EYN6_9BILA
MTRIVFLVILISSPVWGCLGGGGGCCSTPECGNPCGGGVGGYPSGPVSGGGGYVGTGGYGGVGGAPIGYGSAPSYGGPQAVPVPASNVGYSNGFTGGVQNPAVGEVNPGIGGQVDAGPSSGQASYNQETSAQVASNSESNTRTEISEPTGGAPGTDYEIEYTDEAKDLPTPSALTPNAQPAASSYSEPTAVTSDTDIAASISTRPSTPISSEVQPVETPAAYQPPAQLTPSGSQQIEDENEEPRLNYQASNSEDTAQYVAPSTNEQVNAPAPSEDYNEEGNQQQQESATPERIFPSSPVPHAEVPASDENEPAGFVSNLGDQIEAAEFGQTGATPAAGSYPTEVQQEQQVAADPNESETPVGNEVNGDHDASMEAKPVAESEPVEAPAAQVVVGVRPSSTYNQDTFENSQNQIATEENNQTHDEEQEFFGNEPTESMPVTPIEQEQSTNQAEQSSTTQSPYPQLIPQPISVEQMGTVDNELFDKEHQVPSESTRLDQSGPIGPETTYQTQEPQLAQTQSLASTIHEQVEPSLDIETSIDTKLSEPEPPHRVESAYSTQIPQSIQPPSALPILEQVDPSLDSEASIDLKLSEPKPAQRFGQPAENVPSSSSQDPVKGEIHSLPTTAADGSITAGAMETTERYTGDNTNNGEDQADHEADLPLQSPTQAQIYPTTSSPNTANQTPQIEQNTVPPLEPYKNENIGEIITAHEQQIVPANGFRPQPNVQPTVVDNTGGYNKIIRAGKARTFGVRTKPEYNGEPYFFIIRK